MRAPVSHWQRNMSDPAINYQVAGRGLGPGGLGGEHARNLKARS